MHKINKYLNLISVYYFILTLTFIIHNALTLFLYFNQSELQGSDGIIQPTGILLAAELSFSFTTYLSHSFL